MTATESTKYQPSQHLREHPSLITIENVEKLNSMWKRKFLKRENVKDLALFATEFKVPNNEVRDNQKVLLRFLDELRIVLARAYYLKEKGIREGDTVLDNGQECKVLKIRKDFMLQLEGRAGGIPPRQITQLHR